MLICSFCFIFILFARTLQGYTALMFAAQQDCFESFEQVLHDPRMTAGIYTGCQKMIFNKFE